MVRPGMSDGRQFTSYSSSCQDNNEKRKSMSSAEYRKFLQENGSKIMQQNLKTA